MGMTALEAFAFILLPLALPLLGWIVVRCHERALDRLRLEAEQAAAE